MFSKYYQSELTFLRAMGRAFAEANPQTAGLLSERGSDPDVERLLEGFAFLTARVRERLEDGVPEVAHDLAELLVPHYLRPLPAATIVEFTPAPGALRGRTRVPAGAELASTPVDGTACRFRTTADLDLVPAAVQDVTLDRAVGASPTLRIALRAAPQVLPAVFRPEGLRFFVHGELPLASTLVLWVARHLAGVEVRALAPDGAPVVLPRESVRLVGFDPDLPLLPWPRPAAGGYRVLQELFMLPEKFLFFDVRGLDAAVASSAERFEIALRFDRPPELPARVARDTLRLNCAPAVNLFSTAAEPVSVRGAADEHLVRAAGVSPAHMAVHSVEAVTGAPEGPGEPVRYDPFCSPRRAPRRGTAFHRLRRARSPVDGGLDTWVSLSSPQDGGPGPGPQTLSLDLVCTNRGLPARLRVGDVCQPTKTSPTLARFKNVVAVSRAVDPPLGGELHWRLLAHLAGTRTSLARADALAAFLELYNFQSLADEHAGRANRLRIAAIRDVVATPVRRVVEGAPVRGTRVELVLDEAGFAGPGDAFLFASAIDDLFAARAPLSSFTELAVRLEPSRRAYGFAPRNGRRAIP